MSSAHSSVTNHDIVMIEVITSTVRALHDLVTNQTKDLYIL